MAANPIKQKLLADIEQAGGWEKVYERVASGESQTAIAESLRDRGLTLPARDRRKPQGLARVSLPRHSPGRGAGPGVSRSETPVGYHAGRTHGGPSEQRQGKPRQHRQGPRSGGA